MKQYLPTDNIDIYVGSRWGAAGYVGESFFEDRKEGAFMTGDTRTVLWYWEYAFPPTSEWLSQ